MTDPKTRVKASDPTFTAGDVKNAAGLSYRQVNNWEAKGTLPSQPDRESGWRRFSPCEIFAIMVCKEIRDRFGTPLQSLRFVRRFMLQDGADHLQAAVEMMEDGLAVFILTDLKETFVLDSDLEFEDMFGCGYLHCGENQGYVFIQVNHLVNRLLACLKRPVALRIDDRVYGAVSRARLETAIRNEQEFAVIRAIRQGDYKRVSLTMKNDEEMLLEVEQELPASDTAKPDLNSILSEHDFQTVTVSRHAGRNVRIKRTLPTPLRHRRET